MGVDQQASEAHVLRLSKDRQLRAGSPSSVSANSTPTGAVTMTPWPGASKIRRTGPAPGREHLVGSRVTPVVD
jgi:hypothetical protein